MKVTITFDAPRGTTKEELEGLVEDLLADVMCMDCMQGSEPINPKYTIEDKQ